MPSLTLEQQSSVQLQVRQSGLVGPGRPDTVHHCWQCSAVLSTKNFILVRVWLAKSRVPKQEKWAYKHLRTINAAHICCIGTVFDFYAGTINRAPKWLINIGLEWFYRLLKEPRRMWKMYLIGNVTFSYFILKEKYGF